MAVGFKVAGQRALVESGRGAAREESRRIVPKMKRPGPNHGTTRSRLAHRIASQSAYAEQLTAQNYFVARAVHSVSV
jgi:hypothetical protein